MRERRQTVIITHDGRTTVLTGWRAGAATIGLSLLAGVVLALIVLFLLGAAVTLAAVVLFGLPLAIGLAWLLTWLNRSKRAPARLPRR